MLLNLSNNSRWLRQGVLRDAASHALGDVLPCVDPCVTGMVETGREAAWPTIHSEGGMMRLETLVELKFINSSFSSLFSC